MRIKRLEIQGFKSFKDKTVIQFDHTITGIVGPNGCGKSNIVDAFFWVMGEQSYKHMRGSSSDDLIFNGSSKYSPLGLAEATLVMETEIADLANGPSGASATDLPHPVLQTKEISVTRRLYRSGEGEYFINGQPARLKDIHELFMDTGVGAKGYSVIEQGQIGKIVNAKPEERRLLIEEAAGIAKYKARKKESLRKLESAETNLGRLGDVVQEIERSVGSLERQAQKATQYKKYRDELFDKEVTWGRRKERILKTKLETLHTQKRLFDADLEGARAEIQTLETQLEVDRIHQLTASKQQDDLQGTIQRLASDLTHEKSALDLSRRRQGDLERQVQALEEERAHLLTSLEDDRLILGEKSTESLELEESLQAFQERLTSAQETHAEIRSKTDLLRQQLDRSKRELYSDLEKNSETQSRIAGLNSRSETLLSQLERITSDLEESRSLLVSLEEESSLHIERREQLEIRREDLRSERDQLLTHVKELEQTVRSADQSRQALLRESTQLQSKLSSLEELVTSYEGFSDGSKAAVEWLKKQGKTAFSALSDQIEITSEYETAVEAVLGKKLEVLLLDNPREGIELVTHLREQKMGRASLQVFSTATQNPPVSPDALRAALTAAGVEVFGSLGDFVRVPSQHPAALALLSTPCLVIDSLIPVQDQLAQLPLAGYTLVSRTGEVLSPTGDLQGGNQKASSSTQRILERKRQIQSLKEQLELSTNKLESAEQTYDTAANKLEAQRERLTLLKEELQTTEIEFNSIDKDVSASERRKRELLQSIERATTEHTRLQETVSRTQLERESLEASLGEMSSRKSELEQKLGEEEALFRDAETELRASDEALQGLRLQENSQRGRVDSVRKECESLKRLLSDRERRHAEITRLLERIEGENAEHSGSDHSIEARISELTHALGEQQTLLAHTRDQLEQLSARTQESMEALKTLHAQTEVQSRASTEAAIESERLQSELRYLIQNLEEKYGPECLSQPAATSDQGDLGEPIVTDTITEEEERLLSEEVERLRERIRRLGEVNLGAIEEFEQVKQRHEKLLIEKLDLESSISNLREAIEHINKTSEERFKRAFQAISERFEKLFPIIFGGGSAKLSLLFPEGSQDILEAGVDILAQPPGKKVSNITLLSGGEKALTAVSMIFAIFMVKPSPFCILDEVDAPLDDANIGKFNALLREMSVKSQFILITHNKKTMELNDTLYGVTMEEPGVSKLISIEIK